MSQLTSKLVLDLTTLHPHFHRVLPPLLRQNVKKVIVSADSGKDFHIAEATDP